MFLCGFLVAFSQVIIIFLPFHQFLKDLLFINLDVFIKVISFLVARNKHHFSVAVVLSAEVSELGVPQVVALPLLEGSPDLSISVYCVYLSLEIVSESLWSVEIEHAAIFFIIWSNLIKQIHRLFRQWKFSFCVRLAPHKDNDALLSVVFDSFPRELLSVLRSACNVKQEGDHTCSFQELLSVFENMISDRYSRLSLVPRRSSRV